ncbi:hypothetical protein FRC02_005789 [Tulasnella sp. 418]|nr:hypothetical protein FRC02_005789 [Tulasnella sp. 418]
MKYVYLFQRFGKLLALRTVPEAAAASTHSSSSDSLAVVAVAACLAESSVCVVDQRKQKRISTPPQPPYHPYKHRPPVAHCNQLRSLLYHPQPLRSQVNGTAGSPISLPNGNPVPIAVPASAQQQQATQQIASSAAAAAAKAAWI